jgi:hypothetical protein
VQLVKKAALNFMEYVIVIVVISAASAAAAGCWCYHPT